MSSINDLYTLVLKLFPHNNETNFYQLLGVIS